MVGIQNTPSPAYPLWHVQLLRPGARGVQSAWNGIKNIWWFLFDQEIKLGLKIVIDWSWSCDHPREIFLVDIYINDLICIYSLNKTVKISFRKRSQKQKLKQKHFKFTYLWVATAIVVIAHIVWNTECSVAMEIIVTPTKRLQVQNSLHNSLLLIK